MPKTWFVGSVRSGDPSCPPFGLHCAAARLRWAVVDKLKTPWDVVGGFDRRSLGRRCPCTAVEDLARRIRQRGERGPTGWRIPRRDGPPGGESPPTEAFQFRYAAPECVSEGGGSRVGGGAARRRGALAADRRRDQREHGPPLGHGRLAAARAPRRLRSR